MIAVTDEPPIQKFVPELAQLVITEVTILGAKKFKFEFMDGSVIKI